MKIKKTRILSAKESGQKVTLFVIEMNDGTRWYTTIGGHVAFQTEDPIKSGTNIDNLADIDQFSYYGDSSSVSTSIDTMEKFVSLVSM